MAWATRAPAVEAVLADTAALQPELEALRDP